MKKILIAGYAENCNNYVKAITLLGAVPVVSLDESASDEFDGLILPGGGDIHPDFFGEEDMGSMEIDRPLDEKQFALLHKFVVSKKPVLGICKGLQVINVFFGGKVIQDLPTAHLHKSTGFDAIHMAKALPDSYIAKLYGTEFVTNSCHHQGNGLLGENLTAVMFTEDNVIEALCHDSLPIIGVQWHPERMCFDNKREDTVDGSILLQYFLDLC